MALMDATTKSFSETEGKVTAVWDQPGVYSGEIIKITLTVKGVKPKNTTIKFGDLSCKNVNNDISIEGASAQVALVCEHTYDWVKLNDDKHQQVCSKCQDTKPAENHDWKDSVGNPAPTCTTPGTIEYTCSVCKDTKKEDVSELGHDW